MRKPFYKASHNAWYWKNEAGKMIRLATTEHEAYTEWERIRKEHKDEQPAEAAPVTTPAPEPAPEVSEMNVAALIDTYLEWIGRAENRSKSTHVSYTRALRPLKEMFGQTAAEKLLPKDLDKVVRERLTTYKSRDGEVKRYSETTRWHFYKASTAAFNWARDQGYIKAHCLVRLKDKPECAVRQDWIDQAQFDRLIAACDEPLLRDVLIVLWDTGARPFEIFQAQAKHLDHASRCLRFARSKGDNVKAKRKKKDATRTVRLSDRAYKIVCDLIEKQPEGYLFRNSLGNRWSAGLLSHRMRILKKRSGIEKLTLYTLRHSFCTRLILADVNIRKVQELMGHQDLSMIAAVYAHLNKADSDLNSVLDRMAS